MLSLGGRLILVQALLSNIPVYWLGLAPIPIYVLHKLRSITFAFLWGSSDKNHRYHLVNWQCLSWPKEYGGWGIKNLLWFSIALRLKNFWMVLLNNGLWHRVLISKYMKNLSVVAWLKGKNFRSHGVSIIWKVFYKMFLGWVIVLLGRWEMGKMSLLA